MTLVPVFGIVGGTVLAWPLIIVPAVRNCNPWVEPARHPFKALRYVVLPRLSWRGLFRAAPALAIIAAIIIWGG